MRKVKVRKRLFLATLLLALSVPLWADVQDTVDKGDANNDANVDISDVVTIVDRIYDPNAVLNEINADVNGDGVIDISDVVGVINIIYNGKVSGQGTANDWEEGNSDEEQEEEEIIVAD